MKFHFIIVEYNSKRFLDEFLASIIDYVDKISITVIDNCSNYSVEGFVKNMYLDKVDVVRLDKNEGYGKAINNIALKSNNEYLVICNSDLVFYKDTFNNINKFIDTNPNINLFGGQQVYPNGKLQYSYGDYPSLKMVIKYLFYFTQILNLLRDKYLNSTNMKIIKEVSYLDGAFFIIKSELFKKLNGFDEDFHFYSEDADLCYRARKLGYKPIFTNLFRIQHYRGGATEININSDKKSELIVNGIKIFISKHYNTFYQKLFNGLYRIHIILSIFVNGFINIFVNLFNETESKRNKSQENKINNLKSILKKL